MFAGRKVNDHEYYKPKSRVAFRSCGNARRKAERSEFGETRIAVCFAGFVEQNRVGGGRWRTASFNPNLFDVEGTVLLEKTSLLVFFPISPAVGLARV